MTVDDVLYLFYGEFEIYDIDNEETVYDSCLNSIDNCNGYYFETVQSLDIEDNKLIISI